MLKTLGYMVTWTTYGSWLQGEGKGYVKDGEILGDNKALKRSNVNSQKTETVKLGRREREIVREAILKASTKFKQNIYSMGVCSNHVHIVAEYVDVPIYIIVGYYKNAARAALQRDGFVGRVWTRGYDKRYCFDKKSLQQRIDYVRKHT